jgi:hypothetical protein
VYIALQTRVNSLNTSMYVVTIGVVLLTLFSSLNVSHLEVDNLCIREVGWFFTDERQHTKEICATYFIHA